MFLFMGFVKDDERPAVLARFGGEQRGTTDHTSQTGPLAKVAAASKFAIRVVVFDRVTLCVPNHQITLFLINVGNEKVLEEPPQSIQIKGHLLRVDPIVPHGLQNHADAMQLTVSSDGADRNSILVRLVG